MNSFHFPRGSNSCRAAAHGGGKKYTHLPRQTYPPGLLRHDIPNIKIARPRQKVRYFLNTRSLRQQGGKTAVKLFLRIVHAVHPPLRPSAWACRRPSQDSLAAAAKAEIQPARSQMPNALITTTGCVTSDKQVTLSELKFSRCKTRQPYLPARVAEVQRDISVCLSRTDSPLVTGPWG